MFQQSEQLLAVELQHQGAAANAQKLEAEMALATQAHDQVQLPQGGRAAQLVLLVQL